MRREPASTAEAVGAGKKKELFAHLICLSQSLQGICIRKHQSNQNLTLYVQGAE